MGHTGIDENQGTLPNHINWTAALDTSDDARNFVGRLNQAFSRVVGPTNLLAAVTTLADVDHPLASSDATIGTDKETLSEAMKACYGVEVPTETPVVLVDPEQVEISLLQAEADEGDLSFWDAVLHYIASAYAVAVQPSLKVSRYLSALIVVSEALPLPQESRVALRDRAIEAFLEYHLDREVDLSSLPEEYCDMMDVIQPGAGAIFRSLYEGIVTPPKIEEVQRNMGYLVGAINEFHLLAVMVKIQTRGTA